jgi:hypothetical protein
MTAPPIFPLPLSPFEVYMVVDDRPQYRMTFVMRLDFVGRVNTAALEASLPQALARHPLLTARLDQSSRPWRWQEGESKTTLKVLPLEQDVDYVAGAPIDLASGRGARFWLKTVPGGTQLVGEFHHACADGIGALQFYGDWLAAYAAIVNNEAPAWMPLAPERLQTRGEVRWPPPPHPISFSQALRGTLVEAGRWLTRYPAVIAASEQSPPVTNGSFGGLLSHTFDAQQTRALRNAAREQNVTLNDLLLRDLFVAIDRWNRAQDAGGRGWLQINMPTSLRRGDDDEMPAANVIGYAFLARRPADCADAESLLQGLARDTKAIRVWGLGNLFLNGLRNAMRLPGMMSWFARPGRCMATAVFSNLGDPQRRMSARLPRTDGRLTAGELVLQRVIAAPPIRQGTRAAFLASTCGSELTLCASVDRKAFSNPQAGELFATWLRRIQEPVARAAPISSPPASR